MNQDPPPPEHIEELDSPALKAVGQRSYRSLQSAVLEARAESGRPGDPTPSELTQLAWSVVHGIAWLTLHRELSPVPDRDEATTLARVAIHRLFPSPHETASD